MAGYRPWESVSDRRGQAAWRRGYGDSLRTIASALGVRIETVREDLREWAREHPGQPLPGGPAAKRDRRMADAARLRAEGLTLRQIAARLAVHHQTVANDLARWDRPSRNVVRLPSKTAVEKRIPGSEIRHPDSTAETVIELRRKLS